MSGPHRGGRGPIQRRRASTRVKTARSRKPSSTRWLQRQLNDPYVQAAREEGYRGRAAFKLIELDDRFRLLRRGRRVVDLGAAPGGWSQVAIDRVGPRGVVVAVDIAQVEAIEGVAFLQIDARSAEAAPAIHSVLQGPADVVLSDMAASATGHAATDHLRVIALCEAAFEIAEQFLRPGGDFVGKVLQGGTERELLDRLKRAFRDVRHVKPPASRADSAEIYVVGRGYRGTGDGGSPLA